MNKDQQELKNPRSLGVYLATGLLIISLLFVAVTFFQLARNAQHEQEWLSHATNVQVTSQQLAKSAGEAAAGNLDAFLELGTSRGAIATAMGKLRPASVRTYLPPAPRAIAMPMKKLNLSWDRMSTNASSILEREKLILDLATARKIVQENIPGIQKNTDTSISALTRSGAPTNQLVFASRQLVLADRILRRVSEVLRGGSDAVKAAENLARERQQFEQVLTALLRGSSKLGVTQVRNAGALQSLGRVRTLFENIKTISDVLSLNKIIFYI